MQKVNPVSPRQQALLEILFAQSEDPSSSVSKYLQNLTLRFILEQLAEEKRAEFLKILESEDAERCMEFARSHIPDFQNALQKHLQERIKRVTEKILKQ